MLSRVGAHILEAGFGRPAGLIGRIGGWAMARGNAATELHMVELADPQPADVVLVLGPGPGIGLREAGRRAARVIGVEPSAVMRHAAGRRCAELIEQGRVHTTGGTAADTAQPDATVDIAISVNNVALWPEPPAGFAELWRVLRPGGRLFVSAHRQWLPGGSAALSRTVEHAGFVEVRTWDREPVGRGAIPAVQLSARRPAD